MRTEVRQVEEEVAKRPAGNPLGVAAVVLLLISAVAAAWFGWSWHTAANDDSLRYSRLRDDALRSGLQAVQNLNTLDHRNVDRDLKIWQDSTTADLYQQIVQGRSQFTEEIGKVKTITTAKILDGALTELDEHAGKARVIVSLELTVIPAQGQPATKRTRLIGQLTKTATGWKLNALGQAPVGTSGS